ncbi:DegT/DnrJ/EryC1/StrS family aminotransferase [Vibrio fluvialis]|uniref:DegT/DnrJ/EryC1/StrS family aminotransferase n=1 Tax=Vibrio fluvialis TaxID=676 RepID=UPI00117E9162|nr:DegT/DnrJ/EryC1/StrS family aminotransferase [Vibrio fluvialis]EKO3435211.1 DegT/DnrJ/EryC1/StrS family aminotransferase [Vibrio fluvialis]MBY7800084.1 DegT/DnrJ/EryC1/StrS family aminotransferase [Vibrio fluvialis]MBY8091476.1 DegT/DnrJ/EryC1/StrS family aminotransferase [Vibrio fluvialis]MBY8100548.1 DegT/DnrJ/EryC1/StrS family aminotransferase [Vibrio fluvialis]MBY8215412.1 DegT/DnrJ/EryC1/StrS family aminotransferase [Vibrio fluvialis]
MATQLFIPKFRVNECLEHVKECLEKGWTGMGFKTVEIEEKWKEYTGLPHAHFLSSATAGLHLAFEVLKRKHGWQNGDEVISASLTFVSTNHAIKYAGLEPVFADVDEYLCLDPKSIEEKITSKTKAVVFVGLGGNTGQLDAVAKLCKDRGLSLVLDAAHMSGSRLHGKHVGHNVDVTVFSYQAVKNMPTADSGMICFMEEADDVLARKLTWLGINKDTYARTAAQGAYKWKYDVEDLGFKYHGNSIMAGIGLVSLKYLDQDNAYRRQLAKWYREELEGCEAVRVVPIAPNCESSTHLLQIRVDNRDELLVKLNENEVYPGVHYTDNSEYKMYEKAGRCPKALKASDEIISLPMHMNLTQKDVLAICKLVKEYAR